MKTILRIKGLHALLLILPLALSNLPYVRAMPADPRPFDFTQPDGSKVTLRLRGDEFFHWHEDMNGFTVMREGGRFVYATLDIATAHMKPTIWQAGKVDPRAVGLTPGRVTPAALRPTNLNQGQAPYRPWAAKDGTKDGAKVGNAVTPPVGTVKNLVVLCLFGDHTIATDARQQSDYNVLFNQAGGDPVLAPTGSVKDAYTELSYGTVTLDSTVTVWVTLPFSMSYYAGTNNGQAPVPPPAPPANPSGYPNNAQKMVEDALALVDPLVDFGQFDSNNDGYIDAIDFIHSGYGAETAGAPANSLWSQKWGLPADWVSADNNGNGVKVKVNDFHTEAALWGTSGTDILRIGVICHETGHFFGLPDLYDTDPTSKGIGAWCMMADSWGFAGDQLNPPHFSAWCKVFLGWVSVTNLNTPGTYSIGQSETNPQIYKASWGFPPGEYLLIENRQPTGFDMNIPRGGLAVWHIDENMSNNTQEGFPGQFGWPGNGKHYKVALLQADGNYDLEHNTNKGDAGDLFQPLNIAQLGMNSEPGTDAYQGGTIFPTTNRITGISASGPAMSFTYGFYPNALYVWKDYSGVLHNGTFNAPFTTITDAYNAASNGSAIVFLFVGDYPEPPFTMNKQITLDSWYGSAVVH